MFMLRGDAPGETAPTPPKADSSVAELQRTLKAYAQLSGYTPADPGPVDGIVGMKTALAVLMVVPRIPKVPDEIKAIAALGPLALSNDDMRDSVFKAITRYAGYISAAIIAAQAYQAVNNAGGPTTPPTPTGTGGKKPGQYANIQMQMVNAVTGWQTQTTPSGGAVPTNPTSAIFFWDFWTQSYRVAVPRGPGLGAGGYQNYVEVSSAKSRPAMGTEVNRNTFMSATGKWWGTTGGIIGIAVGVVGAGAGAVVGVRALRR